MLSPFWNLSFIVLFEEDKLNKWANLEIFMRDEKGKDDKLGQQASEKQKEITIRTLIIKE